MSHPHDTPDTETDHTHQYQWVAPTPDPTDTPPFEETYASAYAKATTVLEMSGLNIGGRDADRIVSTVLGAALLELERPWRDELHATRLAARIAREQATRLGDHLERTREQRDRTQIHADYLTARLHTATTDANRRGQLIDDIELILDDLDPGAGACDPQSILDALEMLRDEIAR